jgi:hypothetical protein
MKRVFGGMDAYGKMNTGGKQFEEIVSCIE